jgi:hypothetical protein
MFFLRAGDGFMYCRAWSLYGVNARITYLEAIAKSTKQAITK